MASEKKQIPIRFRKLRHWKQRFDKGAKFIWRRSIQFNGKRTKIGGPIPKSLQENKSKLRRFWEAGTIELALFEAPQVSTGKVKVGPTDAELAAAEAKAKAKADKKAAADAKRAEKKAATAAKNAAKKAAAKKAREDKAAAKKAAAEKAKAEKAKAEKPEVKESDETAQ